MSAASKTPLGEPAPFTSVRRISALAFALGSLATVGLATEPLDNWHVRQAPAEPASEAYEGVAYGNNQWVIVGDEGSILSSPDGVTWTHQVNPLAPSRLDDIAFGNGLFVAIGRNANVMVTSPDGHTWTKQTPGMSGAIEMIHDGTRFLTVVAGGALFVSTNGVNWAQLDPVPVNYDIGGIAVGNGVYVEAGYKRTGKPADLFSTGNLIDWTKRDAKVSQNLMNAGFGLGMFVVVGQGGTLLTSTDGAEWTPRTTGHTGFIWDVACDGQHLVAAAQWGRLLTSDNGIDWYIHETDLSGHFTDIAFGKDTFVAVGWDKQIVQSDPVLITPPGGKILLQQSAKTGNQFTFRFAAEVGKSYQVQTCTDLKSWAPLTTVTATSSPMPFTDPNASLGPRFYRVFKP